MHLCRNGNEFMDHVFKAQWYKKNHFLADGAQKADRTLACPMSSEVIS